LDVSEEPVYDLSDHPDFKYRPGSVVIRVANFPTSTGNESSKSSAGSCGQVLDNCTSGEVEVWWVDGSISKTWPQDLYKVTTTESAKANGEGR
jgi:ubiquitin-conjugating enzyme E2 O